MHYIYDPQHQPYSQGKSKPVQGLLLDCIYKDFSESDIPEVIYAYQGRLYYQDSAGFEDLGIATQANLSKAITKVEKWRKKVYR